jgi:ABC-type phosphate/phosphonate transport system substrate-binding protein
VKSLVFANFMAPNVTSVYTDVATRVGQALGIPTRLIEGIGFEQLRDGSVDLAFLCGLPYIRLCRERPGMLRPLAAPVLGEPRYGDRPVYFSDVIVRQDSPFQSFADLRGRRWAYNDPDSFSGCLVVQHRLLQMGETEAFFGQVRFSGRHQQSIQDVLDAEVDGAAIDSHVLGVERLRNPELPGKLRVIASLGPSTIPSLVATSGVPQAVQDRVCDVLCGLGEDPASRAVLASGMIRRFTPIGDRAYDDIREATAMVESAAQPSAAAGWRA